MKNKTTAVLLAVLFGMFTWIYTYKEDYWKFWINLALCIITLGYFGFVTWVWAIIDTAVRDDKFYKRFK